MGIKLARFRGFSPVVELDIVSGSLSTTDQSWEMCDIRPAKEGKKYPLLVPTGCSVSSEHSWMTSGCPFISHIQALFTKQQQSCFTKGLKGRARKGSFRQLQLDINHSCFLLCSS
jgi:hypothetical protein